MPGTSPGMTEEMAAAPRPPRYLHEPLMFHVEHQAVSDPRGVSLVT